MGHIRAAFIAVAGILSILVPGVRADSLQLKNGNFLQGKYLGGSERAVQFEVNGKVRLYDTGEILSINFAAASADGGMPSNSADPSAGASTEFNSAARDSSGLRTAHWNQKKPDKAPARPITWLLNPTAGKQDSTAAKPTRGLDLMRPSVVNADPETGVWALPARSVHSLLPRFPMIFD